MKKTVLSLLVLFLFGFSPAHALETKEAQDQILAASGFWYTEDKEGVIEIYPCGPSLCGRFYWVEREKDGSVSRDDKNPDPALRKRPLCGTQFMGDFKPEGTGHFSSGWIYSPRHGSFFSAKMTLRNPETLVLRGYVLFPALGENQTWTRAHAPQKCIASDAPEN